MGNKYIKKTLFALMIVASFVAMMPAFAKDDVLGADTTLSKTLVKLKDNRPNRPIFDSAFKTDFDAFMFKMTAVKTGSNADKPAVSGKNQPSKNIASVALDLQKPIDNVKVYPNPVSDQLNLSYSLKRESLVTIKILDVLGNEVSTLLNQKMGAGTQTNKFMIDSRLNTGFYFVRIIAGSDSIVKRISVL